MWRGHFDYQNKIDEADAPIACTTFVSMFLSLNVFKESWEFGNWTEKS